MNVASESILPQGKLFEEDVALDSLQAKDVRLVFNNEEEINSIKRRLRQPRQYKKAPYPIEFDQDKFNVAKFKGLFDEFEALYVPKVKTMDDVMEDICHNIDEDEAFYVVDLSQIVRQMLLWKKYLPRVQPFYAVKCNNSFPILKVIAAMGGSFDCASKEEIETVLDLGVDPKRIIFANPCKQTSHLKFAQENGVKRVTLDNIEELHKLKKHYKDCEILIRLITDDSKSICKFSGKFGATTEQAEEIIKVSKELGFKVTGVSFHVGSGCLSPESFEKAIRDSRNVFDMGRNYGYEMNVLDLGGGWNGYKNVKPSFIDIANSIRDLINELFPKEVEVIAEPGRYFATSAFTLACNVYGKRSNEKETLYYINEGIYQSFNCIYFDHFEVTPKNLHIIKQANREVKNKKCAIFGQTCDSIDIIAKDIEIQELHVGDWIYFKEFGAYTISSSSRFNGMNTHKFIFIWKN